MSDLQSNQPESTDARIFLSELRLPARVGVNPGERGAAQPIVVDLWVGLEQIAVAAHSERLRDTVDYVGLARVVRKVVERRHYPLVETLASAIGAAVLERPGVTWATVRLKKLDCLKHASGAGVEVTVRRSPEPHPDPIEPDAVREPEEVVVVGGGAAGFAAALWCWRLGHPALLVDPAPVGQLGGQLQLVHGPMRDLPALPPVAGRELAVRLWRQFIHHQGRWLRARLVGVEPRKGAEAGCTLSLQLAAGSAQRRSVRARVAIFAMGVRRRSLGVVGEQQLLGKGLLPTASREIAWVDGHPLAVIGGGDAACENALLLARAGAAVTLVHRGPQLATQDQFRAAVERTAAITVRLDTRVTRFIGEDRLEGVEIERHGGTREILPVSAALIRIGWQPNSEVLPESWLDPRGFLRCDSEGQISGESLCFACGDLLGRISPSVATAFGTGASAARGACQQLELLLRH